MLDQLSDMDPAVGVPVVKPKLTTQSVDAEESVRHLTREDLKAYANGQLTSARLSHCQAHLDSCEDCRDELEDLRTYKNDMSTFPRPEPNRGMLGRRKQRRGLALPLAAAAVTLCVAAVVTVFWWKHGSPRANRTSAAMPVAQSPAAPTTPVASPAARKTDGPAVMPALDTRLANEIAALPGDMRPGVSEAIQQGRLQLPADVNPARVHAATSPVTQQANQGFVLLGPFGEAISETHPEFSWQPLPGAIGYSVAIVDTGLHPVEQSPALRATTWRPRRPLLAGHTYLWQVTATLRGGRKVVASGPPTSETLLRIIPPELADQLAHFQRQHPEAHLVLGELYAQAGMLTESADELRKVPPSDATYNTAQTLLAGLSSTNP